MLLPDDYFNTSIAISFAWIRKGKSQTIKLTLKLFIDMICNQFVFILVAINGLDKSYTFLAILILCSCILQSLSPPSPSPISTRLTKHYIVKPMWKASLLMRCIWCSKVQLRIDLEGHQFKRPILLWHLVGTQHVRRQCLRSPFGCCRCCCCSISVKLVSQSMH